MSTYVTNADAQTGKDYYAIYFPVETVIATIAGDASGITSLNAQTMAAGSTLLLRVTAITLTSGIGIGYTEHDGTATA
jgi:hypothetical protein